MNSIKTILVDDEPGNIITLQELLKKFCPFINITGTAENIEQAEELIKKQQPDLVFLDIEMPYGNAFDLLEKLRPAAFEVVFVTAFDDYAIKAFKYAALDYILKPVNIPDLREAAAKVLKRINEKGINSKIELLLSNIKSGQYETDRIALPTIDGLQFEALSDIIFLQSNTSYTTVHLKGGRKYIVSKILGDIEAILPPTGFCRIHNSFIINIHQVKKYHKGRGGYVVMHDGTSIEVSVRKKDDFPARFKF
jgi:two-component system, LytTR family, response regulator